MINPVGNLKRFWSKVSVKFEINSAYERCGSEFCEGCQNGNHCWRRWPCWNWKVKTWATGYGKISIRRKNHIASRLAYELATQSNPGDLCVLHHCDNRRCCNPKHLYLGTKGDNARDAAAKGRTLKGDRCHFVKHPEARPRGEGHWSKKFPEKITRGSKHGMASLNEWSVCGIMARYLKGVPSNQIAHEFGVTPTHISRIINRKSWEHLFKGE